MTGSLQQQDWSWEINFQRSQLPSPLSMLKCYINSTQHNFNNHWTVSRYCRVKCIIMTAYKPIESTAPELQKQLITLYAHTSKGATLQINQPQVQLQRSSKDCFAVTFAVSLFLGDDATTLTLPSEGHETALHRLSQIKTFCSFSSNRKGKEKKSRCQIEHSAINMHSHCF